MKLLTAAQIRQMDATERLRKLVDLREELMMLYSTQTGGGVSDNPAKAKNLRKQIARILTVNNEEKLSGEVEEWYEEE
ncbi:MAG: 50S ribosomal protein L29 [Promethearchaeota archaeon]|nr:MAG: 50S ribosomal protein L29 [Candidatus Lokiarchaeota archaeon]